VKGCAADSFDYMHLEKLDYLSCDNVKEAVGCACLEL
jgi:hypothetical protein